MNQRSDTAIMYSMFELYEWKQIAQSIQNNAALTHAEKVIILSRLPSEALSDI